MKSTKQKSKVQVHGSRRSLQETEVPPCCANVSANESEKTFPTQANSFISTIETCHLNYETFPPVCCGSLLPPRVLCVLCILSVSPEQRAAFLGPQVSTRRWLVGALRAGPSLRPHCCVFVPLARNLHTVKYSITPFPSFE